MKWREMGRASLNILKEIAEACSAYGMNSGSWSLKNRRNGIRTACETGGAEMLGECVDGRERLD